MEENAIPPPPRALRAEQTLTPHECEVETQDGEMDDSEQMSKAIHQLSEALNWEDINVNRCRLHVVAEPDP